MCVLFSYLVTLDRQAQVNIFEKIIRKKDKHWKDIGHMGIQHWIIIEHALYNMKVESSHEVEMSSQGILPAGITLSFTAL